LVAVTFSASSEQGGGDGEGLGEGDGLGLGDGEGLGDGDGLGDGEALGLGEGEGLGDGEGLGLGDALGIWLTPSFQCSFQNSVFREAKLAHQGVCRYAARHRRAPRPFSLFDC